MKWETDNIRLKKKISKFKYLEARATGSHLNPINSHTSHLSTALLHSQVYQQKPCQAARKQKQNVSVYVYPIRTNEDDTKYYVLNWTLNIKSKIWQNYDRLCAIIIKNLTDQVKLKKGTQFKVRKKIP